MDGHDGEFASRRVNWDDISKVSEVELIYDFQWIRDWLTRELPVRLVNQSYIHESIRNLVSNEKKVKSNGTTGCVLK
jgi:hypothetical protein